MFGINLKVLVAMVTELCTHSISAMACIPVLILKSQKYNFSQTNNFSQIINFGVLSVLYILTGFISMEEFEDALNILIRQLEINIQQQEIRDIAISLDLNKDGQIDFNEFLEAFRIVDTMGTDRSGPLRKISTVIREDEETVALQDNSNRVTT